MSDDTQSPDLDEPNDLDEEEDAYAPSEPVVDQSLNVEEIDVQETPFTVSDLVRKIQRGQLLTPDFQRRVVWSEDKKSWFIESVLLNYPLPPLFLNQTREGKYLVIDGLQRSTALRGFVDGWFALTRLRTLAFLNGKCWRDIPQLQSRIEDRKINCYVLKPSVPLKVVYDIFHRINTGGSPLTQQEIRHALFQGPVMALLDQLAQVQDFRSWLGWRLRPARMGDQEAALRCIAFARIQPELDYRRGMDKFLETTLRELNEPDARAGMERQSIERTFRRVWPIARKILGEDAFRLPTEKTRGRLNLSVIESVYHFFAHHADDWLVRHTSKIRANYGALLRREDYRANVRWATGDVSRVRARFQIAREALGGGIAD